MYSCIHLNRITCKCLHYNEKFVSTSFYHNRLIKKQGHIGLVANFRSPSRNKTTHEAEEKDTSIKLSDKENHRINALNIQMLSKSLHDQIFGTDASLISSDPALVKNAKEELKKYGLWSNKIEKLPDVPLKIPQLHGENIEEHFRVIGEEQSGPYRRLLLEFIYKGVPELPNKWLFQKGWVKYAPDEEPKSVMFPDEDALVFDVEVCMKQGNAPTLAVALSANAWYAWTSSSLFEDESPVPVKSYTTELLIPLEGKSVNKTKERVVVCHNASFDRSRVKEQYYLNSSALRFVDTLSLHICIAGLSSGQRILLKKYAESNAAVQAGGNNWRDLSSLNNLQDVYKLYCKGVIDKVKKSTFIEGTLQHIRVDFQNLMTYCANDTLATYKVLQVMFPLFLDRFPHPVTFAGMLELSTAYLPVNENWERYITDSDQTYEDMENESIFLLARKSDNACQLMHDQAYKTDLWMWDQDWSVRELSLLKNERKGSQTSNEKEEMTTVEKQTQKEKTEEEEEEVDHLKKKFQHLFDMENRLPTVHPHLPGYPAWYRKLCQKSDTSDWTPRPQLISTNLRVTPKLLKLTWQNFPLHYKTDFGWGVLVADLNASPKTTVMPFEALKKLTLKNQRHDLKPIGDAKNSMDDLNKKVDESISKAAYWMQTRSFHDLGGLQSNLLIEGCCHFLKLPHKDGPGKNVGSPLAKDFLKTFSDSVLTGSDSAAEKVLSIAKSISYWRNNRDRIKDQMVVWLRKRESGQDDVRLGAILPKLVVCGTLTRRASEPTWLTASNVQSDRIGSELRAMVQAPPGYHFVGADVDSEELWLSSLLGDAHFAKQHGSTPFGWMTLSGLKEKGTDMHYMTAKTMGISRDEAKVINYSRIYGAGVRFAQQLLQQFQPMLPDAEAKAKVEKMFTETKGRKVYRFKSSVLKRFPDSESVTFDSSSARRLARELNVSVKDLFDRGLWQGGTESAMFNCLEEIASSPNPVTPFLESRLSRALEPYNNDDDSFLTTRLNWVVQSGAVDFLHLMLVCMRWLTKGQARFTFSFHDEIRYLVPSDKKYNAALAMNVTNLLTRSFCARRLGIYDLPRSVAFFSSVEVDTALRKDGSNEYTTPSNPHGLEKGYGIAPGENLDIYETLEKSGGTLDPFSQQKLRYMFFNKATPFLKMCKKTTV